ncbi:VCBS domain-containing protein [Prosthecochloris sp. SCSIO W1103]|uniref:VCBS domain-containing protein n=1 Tax=Prosthecochloris sp. SCSIO W1103 TaxID=2992244 RepID=UPI00223D44C5|nr:VCBS domain-containing protein [Prosthecochloris sp. SCSIO W1103]UZJ38398.1 VCBS domain-containing protein [Prosthecochloris sp. SCSIO W1103]
MVHYTYSLDDNTLDHSVAGNDTVLDSIGITVTDTDGDTSNDTLDIEIVDDVAVAVADTDSVGEDSSLSASGNVVTDSESNGDNGGDTLGADNAPVDPVTGVAAGSDASSAVSGNVGTSVTGSYGSVVINADGSYTYTLDNTNPLVQGLSDTESLTDTFVYTISDADGDESTTTLTITINGSDDGTTIEIPDTNGSGGSGDETVYEAGLADGSNPGDSDEVTSSFTITAPDGLGSITVVDGSGSDVVISESELLASATTNITIDTEYGTLVINGYTPNASTGGGVVHYTYSLDDNTLDHSVAGNDTVLDSIGITVTDTDGDTSNDTLDIEIVDDVAVAVADTDSVGEDSSLSASGNVVTDSESNGDNGGDTLGADNAPVDPVTGVAAGSDASSAVCGNVGTSVTGSYGSVVINADGSYTYTLDNTNPLVQGLSDTESLTDTFVYTISDADGDESTTTLTITINGSDDGTTIEIPDTNGSGGSGDETVYEAGLADGSNPGDSDEVTSSFTITAPDGLGSITVVDGSGSDVVISESELLASATTNITIDTEYGTLVINGYTPNASTGGGVVHYTYSLDDNTLDHSVAGNDTVLDSIGITVTDTDGDTSNDTLDIEIVDDVAVAVADTDSVGEDSSLSASGNVVTDSESNGDNGGDTLGADNAPVDPVTGVAAGSDASSAVSGNVGTSVTGSYGSVVINADGSYTYTLDNTNPLVQGLSDTESLTDTFVYTISDADGDESTTTLTITINGSDDGTTIEIPDTNGSGGSGDETVYEAGLADGSNPGDSDEVTSSFTITAPDGLGSITVVDGSGSDVVISESELLASATTNITIDTEYGTLVINGYTPNASTGGGVVHYTYSLDDNTLDHSVAGNDTVLDSIGITVTDTDGDTSNDTLDIEIVDDVAVAVADTDSVGEDSSLSASGNVVTDSESNGDNGGDTLGADNAPVDPVTGVAAGSDASSAVSGNVGTSVTGSYGSVVINADGSYTYTLDNTNPLVQGLSDTESLTDTFVYTISDADGDESTTTLTITINGSDDGTTIEIPDTNGSGGSGDETVYEAGLADGSNPGDSDEVTSSFTITAPDGLGSITVVDGSGSDVVISESELLASATTNITIDTEYGTLVINGYTPNASTGGGVVHYTYSLDDNTLDHSVAGNDTVLDSIGITVTDTDGDTSNDTLDIEIVDDVAVAVADTDSVGEDSSLSASGNVVTDSESNGDNGGDTLGADNAPVDPVTGVAAGSDASSAVSGNVGTSVTGSYGSVVINADGSYTYTLDNTNPLVQGLSDTESLTDTFVYTISDADGDESTTTLTITINGSDDGTTIEIPDTNGSGGSGDETVYEAGLADGSNPGDSDEVTSSFTITAPDGLGSITVVDGSGSDVVISESELLASATTNITIDTEYGTLVINGYTPNASTGGGVVHYTYSLDDNTLDHSVAGNDTVLDSIGITVTDTDGDTSNDTLDIEIVDDVAVAVADTDSVGEDSSLSASGNVVTDSESNGDNGGDTLGADNAPVDPVTGVAAGSDASSAVSGNVGTSVTGSYGSVVINADGSYTYTLDNTNPLVQGLSDTESLTDTFVYTISDADGDESTTTLTITINGSDDGTTIEIPDTNGSGGSGDETVYEAGLADGSNPGDSDEVTSSFTITAPDGLGSITVVDGSGSDVVISESELLASATTNITIDTEYGTLVINGYTPNASTGGGVVHYTYSLDDNTLDHSVAGNDTVLDSIGITVTDTDGDTSNDTLDIEIVDDVAVAVADTDSVGEDSSLSASGNVVTDSESNGDNGGDTLGADNAPVDPVTGVAAGSDASSAVSGNVGTSVTGSYGSVVINADGSYTYTLDNTNPLVQGLSDTESLTDTFVYTISDADGDESTTTLTITINGSDDGTTIEIPDTNGSGGSGDETVYEAGLADGSNPGDSDEVTSSFTITAPDGLGSITVVDGSGSDVVISESELLASATTNITIDTEYGTLVINGYTPNASTGGGVVHYTYSLDDNTLDHSVAGNDTVLDSIGITVTDTDGDTSNDTLDIEIVDDVAVAVADTDSVGEDSSLSASGNVVTDSESNGDNGGDTLGADNAPVDPVTGVAAGSDASSAVSGNVGTSVTGSYGSVVINADGSYTYTLDNTNPLVQGLSDTESLTDTFVYTISDADGDESTTTLTITINGSDDGTTIEIPDTNGSGGSGDETVYEAGLADGSNPGDSDEVTSSFTITAPDGLGSITVVDGSGSDVVISESELLASATTNITIDTEYGTLVINGYTPNASTGGGVVHYTYSLDDNTLDHSVAGNDTVLDSIGITVTDTDGDTSNDTLDIEIVDDVAVAVADTDSVGEDSSLSASGNVVTDSESNGDNGGDTLGADNAPVDPVTGVAAGSDASSAVSGNVGTSVTAVTEVL